MIGEALGVDTCDLDHRFYVNFPLDEKYNLKVRSTLQTRCNREKYVCQLTVPGFQYDIKNHYNDRTTYLLDGHDTDAGDPKT